MIIIVGWTILNMSSVEVLWIMTKNVTVFCYFIENQQAKMQDCFWISYLTSFGMERQKLGFAILKKEDINDMDFKLFSAKEGLCRYSTVNWALQWRSNSKIHPSSCLAVFQNNMTSFYIQPRIVLFSYLKYEKKEACYICQKNGYVKGDIQWLRGHNFALFWPPPRPRSHWMFPYLELFLE